MHRNLHEFLAVLRAEGEIKEITVPVDPYLEAAEIHRRIIAAEGPALLFKNIKGSPYPLVTNLFGSKRRIDLAFGSRPENLIAKIAKLPETLMPPTPTKLWQHKSLFWDFLSLGLRRKRTAPVNEVLESPPKLSSLPLLTTWKEDAGPFITLPLVYTEHPTTKVPNLGMYRLQRFSDASTGFHCQIGKGGGFHLAAAKELKQKLPVNIVIGGPPALILSAMAPLPENVPELLLASLIAQQKMIVTDNPFGMLPILGEADFVLVGEVDPHETRPEGPFGDHYGYYSLQHDYPVFRCKGVLRRKDPICTATVVGKPRQEDFFLGDYVQELLSPLFPVVMPAVKDLWSYGETGYHSLAAAVVKQRYKREAMASAFRILGEGQLSLTKFLLVTDRDINLRDFKGVLEHILERADFRSDLYVFSNLSMDTLDYTGPTINEGSKCILLGLGDVARELPKVYEGEVPLQVRNIFVYCRGCLVIDGPTFSDAPTFGDEVVKDPALATWPLIVLVDNAKKTGSSTTEFLWSTFTRFEPAADIKSHAKEIVRNHVTYHRPILIDARVKPSYPKELECDPETEKLVNSRWGQYFDL